MGWLGLVEFEKCTILGTPLDMVLVRLGLVEFEKCTIFGTKFLLLIIGLGLVEFEKCTILLCFSLSAGPLAGACRV